MRTYIYIDGFNFYYDALKNTPFKWLDFKKLFTLLLQPKHQILAIKYFTALVSARSFDPDKTVRQNTYLMALKAYIPEIEIYYGHFLSHSKWMPLANSSKNHKYANVIKTEEKGSDVNLAVHLINDAWLDKFDCAVIVSNDSDLAEAIRLVKAHHPQKIIGLITPSEHGRRSKQLTQYITFCKRIRKGVLQLSQLPNPIPGTTIHKPTSW